MTGPAPEWNRAMRALSALAVDPAGLKGMVIRARPSPAQQTLGDALCVLPLPLHRIHPNIEDSRLFGGLNFAATLSRGEMVRERGLADAPATLVLPMAERTPPGLAARLAQLLDADRGHALVLLDESATDDEGVPSALSDRLAFHVDVSAVAASDARLSLPAPVDLDQARRCLAAVRTNDDRLAALAEAALRFGIDSLRAPLLALRCARALAALDQEALPGEAHLREAVQLVYPARAQHLPEEAQDSECAPEEPPPDPGDNGGDAEGLPSEMLIDAVRAMLPPELLANLEGKRLRQSGEGGSGAGVRKAGNRRGRPLPARAGRPDGRARIDVIATLRTAAPWQTLRHRARPGRTGLVILPSDIRLRRLETRSDRLVIFAVDASGSAAMARMAEAKGAVELLLAEAYAKRDQVALVAFRGEAAEVLLPPTRSLVQAKRRLATLPGGGGTPLAAGLKCAVELALLGRRSGLSPTLALLTDGRANIALCGKPDRAAARMDAEKMARHWAQSGLRSIVIDTSLRPGREGADLSHWMDATYLALPRADARGISKAADAALQG